jgi:DNA-binding response OmpR family regulator
VRVLLVSDNPRITLQVETAFLGVDDAEVFEVRTPERAVALLDDGEGFSVVVGDADTAPSGGFYLAREIKARAEMGRSMPPVVLLLAREQDRFLAKWSQADAHILKPVDPFNLAEVVQAVVNGRPVPELPGVGSAPTKSLAEVPGDEPGIGGIDGMGTSTAP